MMLLIHNEFSKTWYIRRWWIASAIISLLVLLISTGILWEYNRETENIGSKGWRAHVQEQILRLQQREEQIKKGEHRFYSHMQPVEKNNRISMIHKQIRNLQYALHYDMDPRSQTAFRFTEKFISMSSEILLPALVILLTADIISGERERKTLRALLTSVPGRFYILISKTITCIATVSLLLLLFTCLTFLLSGVFLGYKNGNAPLVMDSSLWRLDPQIEVISQIQAMIMSMGLAWLSSLAIAAFSLLTSVWVRNSTTAACILLVSISITHVAKIMVPKWQILHYLPFFHLGLPHYLLSDSMFRYLKDVGLSFSLSVLGIWSLASLLLAMILFYRQDIRE
ncbi:ABC transporter permease subunit [Pasteuria penetrans]|uniref:ABC transporter permease subunit n=1 Tax=Pasteuria penetrans TaxID=86005 RepID=UPI000FBDE6C0|nr:ABC transporter permease subunit [Pasteuria penetrans]